MSREESNYRPVSPLLYISAFFALGLVFFSLIFFGGVRAPAESLIQILFLFSSLPWFLSLFDASAEKLYLSLRPYLFCIFLFFVILFAQCLLGTKILDGFILGSVYSFRSVEYSVQLLVYVLFFLVMVRLAIHRRFVDHGGSILAWVVFGVSLAGMIQEFSRPVQRLLWASFLPADCDSFGPFINNDDFGAFLVLFFPWIIATAHYRFVSSQRFADEWRAETGDQPGAFQKFGMLFRSGTIFFIFMAIFLLGACFFARARSAFAVMVLVLCVYALRYFIFKKRFAVLFFAAFMILCGLFIAYLGNGQIFHEYATGQLWKDFLQRVSIANESLQIWKSFPWFGSGLGSYAFISPKFVTFYRDNLQAFHSYNDFIELLAETGLVGAAVFISAVAGLFIKVLVNGADSKSLWKRLMRFQAMLAILGLAFLTNISFHLKIPAIAILLVVQLAILYCSSLPGNIIDSAVSDSQQSVNAAKRIPLMVFPVAIVLIFVAFFSVRAGTAFYYANNGFQVTGVTRALEWLPQKAEYWHQQAVEYENVYNQTGRREKKYILSSIHAMDQAARLAPSYGYYWFYRGTLLDINGQTDEAIDSLNKSIEWGPHHYRHHYYLLKLYLRECLKATDVVKKQKFSLAAKKVYFNMLSLRVPPPEWKIKQGMGINAYRVLKKFIPFWS